MEGAIGATTTEVAVADQVRLFKGRHLRAARRQDAAVVESKAAEAVGNASVLVGTRKKAKVKYNPETLASMCLKVMAEHFAARPMIHRVPGKQVPLLTSLLGVDLDVEVASANIFDENYWKRRALSRPWKHFQLADHGMTWKQLYLERVLQDLLEDYIPDEELAARRPRGAATQADRTLEAIEGTRKETEEVTEEIILKHLRASKDYVFQLKIEQLLSHIDLNVLFDNLPNLSRLALTFGVKRIGMQYERALFGMKMCDATSLACAIKKTSALTALSLPSNLIDDDLLRMLMTGLISNCTVTHLDLSHNKITNHGVRLLSKLLGPKSVLASLDLCDNQIHVEGGRYLGRALRRNTSLLDLNLRLNRLTDEGGRHLLESLEHNTTLSLLNLGSNSLASRSAEALARLLEQGNSSICALNIACNELCEEDGERLVSALRRSDCPLVSIDVRKNHLGPSGVSLAELVKEKELRSRRAGDGSF